MDAGLTTEGEGVTDAGAGVTGAGGDHVLPALIGAGGLALSAGANLYAQRNSRRLYNAYAQDYKRWQRDFGRNTGRSLKYPMLSAYGSEMAQRTNYSNSLAGSIGTVAGTVGAGSALYGGKLRKYLG